MQLKDLGNIPFRLSVLEAVFPDIKDLSWKAKRLERDGAIRRLKRGMFVVTPEVSGMRINDFLLANHIYGPSYVSMQTALRYYGLIPESVFRVISLTVGYANQFSNCFGEFDYVHCPSDYFSIGIRRVAEGDANFLIASPEKALCDIAVFTPNLNLRYSEEVRRWLEEDMRIELADLQNLDLSIFQQCAQLGRKPKMINQIIKLIENERNV